MVKRLQFNRVACGVACVLVGNVAAIVTPYVWGMFASSPLPPRLEVSMLWGVTMGLFWAVDRAGWIRPPYERAPLGLTGDEAPQPGTPGKPANIERQARSTGRASSAE